MTTTAPRSRGGALAPLDWLGLSWPPAWGPAIRTEDFVDGNQYVIRAELPGIDPAKDARVTYSAGTLRLEVTRAGEERDNMHSEFHYGRFARSIPLPTGADEKTISAVYDRGILEISMRVGGSKAGEQVIPVLDAAVDGEPGKRP